MKASIPLFALGVGVILFACGDSPTSSLEDPSAAGFSDEVRAGHIDIPIAHPTELTFVESTEPSTPDSCGHLPYSDLIVEEGEAFTPSGLADGVAVTCQVPLYRGVAAEGMRLEARLTSADLDEGILLRFDTHDLNGDFDFVAGRQSLRDGEAVMEWIAPQTGEFGLAVDASGATVEGSYELEVRCVAKCDGGMTRYPIVLLHGMGGTDDFIGLFEYYNGVLEALRQAGYDAYVTVVDPVASSTVRAQQLVPQLEAILEQTGARRLNLFGHSQGGVDGRELISTLDFGDRVASLTTIATPHYGSPLVDLLLGLLDESKVIEELVDAVGDIFGRILGRGDQDMPTAFREMSVAHMTEVFNPAHPDDPRVDYYSWAGRTCALLELACQRDWNGEIVAALLAPSYRALQALGVSESDGLVPVDSAQWGEFLGILPADHLDEIGLLIDRPGDAFDHIEFFLAEGERLFEGGK